jgi:hypothetical protein
LVIKPASGTAVGMRRGRAGDASGRTAELAARDVYKKSCIFAARGLILAGSWGHADSTPQRP